MTDTLKDYLKKWLAKADEDIYVLTDLLKSEPDLYTGSICFHAQQAVEKYLKAFLILRSIDFPKTHNLDYLLSLCIETEPSFESIDLASLSEYGVSVRYPDDFVVPTLDEARFYSDLAIQVGKRVKAYVPF